MHCAVYDADGNETIIKGYRLDEMLARWFMETPPPNVKPVAVPDAENMPLAPIVGVRSTRLHRTKGVNP